MRTPELLVVAILFWCTCLLRVLGGVFYDPTFGGEATVALLFAVLLPLGGREALVFYAKEALRRPGKFPGSKS